MGKTLAVTLTALAGVRALTACIIAGQLTSRSSSTASACSESTSTR